LGVLVGDVLYHYGCPVVLSIEDIINVQRELLFLARWLRELLLGRHLLLGHVHHPGVARLHLIACILLVIVLVLLQQHERLYLIHYLEFSRLCRLLLWLLWEWKGVVENINDLVLVAEGKC